MPLKIYTTGLDQYAPGGEAFVKALIIGGPGVGKTRWSSFFPKPFYANCENGLSSVADRKVQAADVKTSQDMLEILVMLKQECRRPRDERRFQTVVIDTLDAFQRKVMDEWLQLHPGESSFSGFEAWGYLNAKMDMLMTRLLNLDMNVIVLVHYTDKTITEGSGANTTTRQEFQLQLSGQIKDKVFNDFDLVGWMDTFYKSVEGKRQEVPGLTFKRTPDKPFLKDRLNCTPPMLEVKLDAGQGEENYANLFASIIGRLDDFQETEDFGEVPALIEGVTETPSGAAPVGPLPGGALPEVTPQEIPLVQYDKVTLQKMARDLEIKLPGNAIKSEFINAIEAKRAEQAAAAAEKPAEATVDTEKGTDAPEVTTTAEATQALAETEAGTVNTATGEVVEAAPEAPEPSVEEAVATAQALLGGTVIDVTDHTDKTEVPATEPVAEKPNPAAGHKCENCGADLADQDQNLVRLAWIKERRKLCNADFEKVRNTK